MDQENNHIVVLGESNFRNGKQRFGIKLDDRRRHMYVVGSTGMGKSEFLKNMAIQDIEEGRGIAFVDPHGDPSSDLLDHVPAHRIKDVIYFDPGDLLYPLAFNVMEEVPFEYRHLVASGLLGVFKKIWVDAWSGRMEYILNNTILALLEHKESTLLGINRMMADKEYRKQVVAELKDPIVKAFWTDEFAKYADKFATEATAAIQNKIGQFISNNLIRNIIGQPKSKIDIRKIMDEGKILIVNVSRGRIGEDASRLLGALLVTKIQLAAMSRVDIPEHDRRDFFLYVDEFQHFATESFANILSEARKFHLCLIMAHQYIKQMEEPVRDAVFGNVGTIATFRVGAEDAEFLEKWFTPEFAMSDIVNLGKYNIYLKLMIDGISSKGFSAATLAPLPKIEESHRDEIISYSREHYATSREVVEKNIADWMGPIVANPELKPRYQEEPRPKRRDEGPRPYRPAPPRPPAPAKAPSATLDVLSGGRAVDFKGRKILQEEPNKKKKAVGSDELKKIIQAALNKK
ncbi:MAG TPA: type IV secretion system DNA-binding domain-containing protein [Candidatus Paceibacterota bacterium]